MSYGNLRDFLRDLEAAGELRRIRAPVDPVLEVTEICQRTLRAGGPALLFEHPKGSDVPLLGNLFGSTQRVARAIGRNSVEELREVGKMLAFLKEPQLPRGLKEAFEEVAAVETGAERAAAHVARWPLAANMSSRAQMWICRRCRFSTAGRRMPGGSSPSAS